MTPSKNEIELAWAAGFFDGEGCTTTTSYQRCSKHKPYMVLRMSVAQVEMEPLKRFFEAVGIGTIRGPYQSKGNRQPHFQWNVSSLDVLKVLDILWPYLSSVKQRQAIGCMDRYTEFLVKYPPKGGCSKKYA